jgi:hypothetical protein
MCSNGTEFDLYYQKAVYGVFEFLSYTPSPYANILGCARLCSDMADCTSFVLIREPNDNGVKIGCSLYSGEPSYQGSDPLYDSGVIVGPCQTIASTSTTTAAATATTRMATTSQGQSASANSTMTPTNGCANKSKLSVAPNNKEFNMSCGLYYYTAVPGSLGSIKLDISDSSRCVTLCSQVSQCTWFQFFPNTTSSTQSSCWLFSGSPIFNKLRPLVESGILLNTTSVGNYTSDPDGCPDRADSIITANGVIFSTFVSVHPGSMMTRSR